MWGGSESGIGIVCNYPCTVCLFELQVMELLCENRYSARIPVSISLLTAEMANANFFSQRFSIINFTLQS